MLEYFEPAHPNRTIQTFWNGIKVASAWAQDSRKISAQCVSKFARYCAGVIPIRRLKVREKWLWSENPAPAAIAARDSSDELN